MKKAAVIYWSKTGNTQKVAQRILKGLTAGGYETEIVKINEAHDNADDLDYFDYDLICFGSPSYSWHVPKQVDDYLKSKFAHHKKQKLIKLNAPLVPGKKALIFCTYSGPHTGIKEAVPTVKYIGQFFEHIGFRVVDELYVLSEFVGSKENSTLGRMGNILGRPNESDLEQIETSVCNLASVL